MLFRKALQSLLAHISMFVKDAMMLILMLFVLKAYMVWNAGVLMISIKDK
jgi:hypothetical protein